MTLAYRSVKPRAAWPARAENSFSDPPRRLRQDRKLEPVAIRLEIVKLPQAKRGFILLPKRLPHVLASLHSLAFAYLLHRAVLTLTGSA